MDQAKEGPAPCGICGGQVREKLVQSRGRTVGGGIDYDVKRICQNPKCNSNTGDMSLTDAV
ncbi:MAG: hypothetical protein J0J03_03855 [Leifsonia sp.]|nr:hypothetical protein [Leifsonia sp.]